MRQIDEERNAMDDDRMAIAALSTLAFWGGGSALVAALHGVPASRRFPVRVSSRKEKTMKTMAITVVIGSALLLLAGCAGSDSDDRRAASLGPEAVPVSWQGDWIAEARYEAGSMVTHEGSTFVAVTATDDPPSPKCESKCAWTITGVAENDGAGAEASLGEVKVFHYTAGYRGPAESPANQMAGMNAVQLMAELPRITQEVNAWLSNIAPWVIRHRADNGTVVGETDLPAGNYVVFARSVFVSAPGLGGTPTPQGSTPTGAALVSGAFRIGSVMGSMRPQIEAAKNFFPALLHILGGGAALQEYNLACTLSVGDQALDTASLGITDSGTASTTLMGLAVLPAGGKAQVNCMHNGVKAGPFVRDLRLVALKLT